MQAGWIITHASVGTVYRGLSRWIITYISPCTITVTLDNQCITLHNLFSVFSSISNSIFTDLQNSAKDFGNIIVSVMEMTSFCDWYYDVIVQQPDSYWIPFENSHMCLLSLQPFFNDCFRSVRIKLLHKM